MEKLKVYIKNIIVSVLRPVIERLDIMRDMSIINTALSRGAASAGIRQVNRLDPASWEFSAFSQNGEDGIINFLLTCIPADKKNKYFVEIGSTAGLDGNCAFLAHGCKYYGLMIDGKKEGIERGRRVASWGVRMENVFLTLDTVSQVMEMSPYKQPDVFSLDIDGNDYYIVSKVLEGGFRPKIIVVEYNSAFGPEAVTTVRYDAAFNLKKAHPSQLYYGASIGAWKKLLEKEHGYKFISVDVTGVNAFFVDPVYFDADFLRDVRGSDFRENAFQYGKFRKDWKGQLDLIKDRLDEDKRQSLNGGIKLPEDVGMEKL